MRIAPGLVVPLAVALGGCPSEDPEPSPDAASSSLTSSSSATGDGGSICGQAPLGDPSLDIELVLTALAADDTSAPVEEGGAAPLIFPPQGGFVIFAGVRATNVDPCGVEIAGVLRDMATEQIRLDKRTINLDPFGDGWGGSEDDDISSFANIPVCPNLWSETNVYGTEYELEVTLTDRVKRSATAKRRVVPVCAEPGEKEAECLCTCKGGYILGRDCNADGGVGGGGS